MYDVKCKMYNVSPNIFYRQLGHTGSSLSLSLSLSLSKSLLITAIGSDPSVQVLQLSNITIRYLQPAQWKIEINIFAGSGQPSISMFQSIHTIYL